MRTLEVVTLAAATIFVVQASVIPLKADIQQKNPSQVQIFTNPRNVGGGPSCPHFWSVYPCKCTVYCDPFGTCTENFMCDNFGDEDDLAKAFDSEYSYKWISRLDIKNSNEIKEIGDIFGDLKFENIFIDNLVNIEKIETDWSSTKVVWLNFLESGITEEESNIYKTIENGSNLTKLNFDFCKNFGDLKSAFPASNTLKFISLEDSSISHIVEGQFAKLTNLTQVILELNHLESLPANAFNLNPKDDIFSIKLSNNQLTDLSVDSFIFTDAADSDELVWVDLDVSYNQLTTFDETFFRGFFNKLHQNSSINILQNPLDCGCDMAWLYRTDGPKYQANFYAELFDCATSHKQCNGTTCYFKNFTAQDFAHCP